MTYEAPIPKMSAESGDKEWARRLRVRYLSGDRLIPVLISMASEALGETWSGGKCAPRVGQGSAA